jgi:AcrR family transcriptional regulator
MPRVADHDERRRQVAHAVQRLISAGGLDGVTVAKTAAEADISVGLVQHYFRSKDEMLLFTYGQILDSIEARLAELILRAEDARTRIEHILLDGLAELMPLDDNRRQEWRVALAFAGRAVDDPQLAAARTAALTRIRSRIAEAITNGKECGETPEHLDAMTEAATIAAYAEGLSAHLYADPEGMPAETALAALGTHLSRLFTGTCHLRGLPPGKRPATA